MDANNKDIRWRQRFTNFEKAYLLLEKYVSIEKLTEIERAGIIQFFEMAFELSWKLMKDYLELEGFSITSPRDAIKQAFQSEILKDGHVWIDALEDRNLTAHTYDEAIALTVEKKIKDNYFPAIKLFYSYMKNKVDQ